MASLKAGCCEGLLCDLALVLPRVSFAGERLKGEELPEDNSSSAGVLTSSETKSSFPSIASGQTHNSTIIKYIFSKIAAFFYPGSQLVILLLQSFDMIL